MSYTDAVPTTAVATRRRQASSLLLASAAILIAGATSYALVGLLTALLVAVVAIWNEKPRWGAVGLRRPTSWVRTLALGAIAGAAIQLFSLTVLGPLLKSLGSDPVDLSKLEMLRGNLPALIILLVYVWIFVALVEEIVFRGFLMPRVAALLGGHRHATGISIALVSLLFGLAHLYQGAPGVLLTGLTGAALCWLYVRSAGNLWLPIIAHGTIDTLGLVLLYTDATSKLPSFG